MQDNDLVQLARQRPWRLRLLALPRHRRWWGLLLAATGLPLVTMLLVELRGRLDLASILLLYLLTVVSVATVGGVWAGIAAALAASALSNWFFTDPFHTWTINSAHDIVALAVFVAVAATVSGLVEIAARRNREMEQARSESAALARLAQTVFDSADPLPQLVRDLRTTLALDAVAVLRREGGHWRVQVSAGTPTLHHPEDGSDAIPLSDDGVLVLAGPHPPADDRRLLAAFAAQLAIALSTRQLAEANRLRTALLAAVSHDLRTPLSSIMASATSLLQRDVQWSSAEVDEFVRAIVTEADRLNRLVGNLLDMSRIRTGAIQIHERLVAVDEILPAALSGLDPLAAVQIDVEESLPLVRADPALLERVLANLVTNALAWSPTGEPVHVLADANNGRVDVHIIDHGPGIPAGSRSRVFQPFQRLDDTTAGGGVGLGLAVAKGFTEAMGGRLVVGDTPGGGTTMTVRLEAHP